METMSIILSAYLALERVVLESADGVGADEIRDIMDSLWYRLGEEEQRGLDQDRLVSGRIVKDRAVGFSIPAGEVLKG
ncbi:MAG: hypothetical protein WEB13_07325 [Dehalococcoidia bacterium]